MAKLVLVQVIQTFTAEYPAALVDVWVLWSRCKTEVTKDLGLDSRGTSSKSHHSALWEGAHPEALKQASESPLAEGLNPQRSHIWQ